MAKNSDWGNSGKQNAGALIIPKDEVLEYDFDEFNFSTNLEGNAASSSSSKIKLHLLGMGFPPALVDRAIDEKGEDNAELLVETILAYSAPSKSDSLDIDDFSIDDKDTCSPTSHRKEPLTEEHPDVLNGVSEKKMTLLKMKFSKHDVESALDKLGEDADIPDLVDFILATQMAGNHDKGADSAAVLIDLEKGQGLTTEELFGTMEKTLKLLGIGFTEQEVSTAIEKYGADLPVSELAASIVAEQCGEKYVPPFLRRISSSNRGNHSIDPLIVKKEEYDVDDGTSTRNPNGMENIKGKRPAVDQGIDEAGNLKRPKQEFDEELNDSFNPTWLDGRQGNNFADIEFKPEELDLYGMENLFMPESSRNLSKTAAKPPYFFVGFLTPLPHATWVKISNFLFSIEPEFANTEGFSALSRHESYIHNLPMENRFHVQPEPPLTIDEAIPNFRKWKPSWDTRKKLSCVNSDVTGSSQLCEKLKKLLDNSNGHLSSKQKDDFLIQCQIANLKWISNHELAPIEPEVLEKILGYPPNYTRLSVSTLTERLKLLSDCFQIDTLAYQLSVLKSRFPHGLNMISVYSGIGAAELALNRLGIRMRLVVSVEPSEAKRKTLKRWWESQRMNGDLVQIESIKRLTSAKLEELMKKYGPINFIFCQNPSSNSSKSSSSSGGKAHGAVDYPMFYEFNRVLLAVRRMLAKKKKIGFELWICRLHFGLMQSGLCKEFDECNVIYFCF